MHIIIGIILFLLALIFIQKSWPTLLLIVGLVFAHSPQSKFFIIGADWQEWEWGLVALAIVLQIQILKRSKKNTKSNP
jgi:hypothetical protein